MTDATYQALNRITSAIAEARRDLRMLQLTLKGEPLEHVSEMLETLESLSADDTGRAAHSSGLMCALYEALKAAPADS